MLDASLLVVQGTDQGNRFPLDVPQLLLGRGSRCDVRISDSEVSREHARLELQEALGVLFERHPGLALAGPPRYRDAYHFHGLERLIIA